MLSLSEKDESAKEEVDVWGEEADKRNGRRRVFLPTMMMFAEEDTKVQK